MGCTAASAASVQDEEVRTTSSSAVRTASSSAVRTASSSADPVQTGQSILAQAAADELQKAVDEIFGTAAGKSLLGLEFSFTIADPYLAECPLIGCSLGFTKLCGYELQDIIGHNCRFLVDPVPAHLINKEVREKTRKFCQAVSRESKARAAEQEAGVPEERSSITSSAMKTNAGLDVNLPGRPENTFLAMQTNARKDGTLFNNMFYMMVVDIALELGKERPYIIALQSELAKGAVDLDKVASFRSTLEARMAKVTQDLASMFYFRSMISRQNLSETIRQSSKDDTVKQFLSAFMPADVETWNQDSFKCVKKLSDAARNKGQVWLMAGDGRKMFAVKEMPNWWIRNSHDEFTKCRPNEMEQPWLDIGCTRLLNSMNWQYACSLHGVYRSSESTFVVSEFCSGGDLFSHASEGESPGPSREAAFSPLMMQLFLALQHLHDFQIVHRDISLENVLLTQGDDGRMVIKIIDFSMASTGRVFKNCPRGKASYEAPEMTRGDKKYDAFLSDTFAAGVIAFSMFMKDYPWTSTKRGQCKIFEYIETMGFRAFCSRRLAQGTQKKITECVSEPVISLLEGLLMFTPECRLTLGEKQFASRRSVWDEDWGKQLNGRVQM